MLNYRPVMQSIGDTMHRIVSCWFVLLGVVASLYRSCFGFYKGKSMFKKILVSIMGTAVLVGCASTHTQEHVDSYADIWYSSRYCSEMTKHMDSDTAAKGIAWAKSSIYVDESSRLQSKLREWIDARRSVSKSHCDSIAVAIRVHEQEEISNARKAASQPPYAVPTPITTNCNTVMGLTRCTTY